MLDIWQRSKVSEEGQAETSCMIKIHGQSRHFECFLLVVYMLVCFKTIAYLIVLNKMGYQDSAEFKIASGFVNDLITNQHF